MPIKDILRPDREKVLVAFLIPVVFFALFLMVNPVYRAAFLGASAVSQTLGFIAGVLLGALIYYPMSCGMIFLYRLLSEEKRDKAFPRKDIVFAVIFIAVFNPLTFSLGSYAFNTAVFNYQNYPCGVEVLGYTDISPARDAMLVTGEIITMADGKTVDTIESLMRALSARSPGDVIIVQTNVRAYSINLTADVNGKAIMGVITTNHYCPRGQAANQSQFSISQPAIDACVASCVHTRDAGDSMAAGPCLLDPIPAEPDWVCDIAHSPRVAADNLPENQCSFYREGKSGHFIELSAECTLINAI